TLTSFCAAHEELQDRCIASLPVTRDAHEVRSLLEATGRLWTNGVRIDWPAVSRTGAGRRVTLPTYPFRRERHWFDHAAQPAVSANRSGTEEITERERDDTM